MRDHSPEDELTRRVEYEGMPAIERPEPPGRQVWCPVCGRTIIDPVIERCCADCEPPQ